MDGAETITPGRRGPWRLLVAALALGFFLTPLALIAGGARVRRFENRALEPAPRLADGWNIFDVATRYLIDRMPLREQAVHANTWIDEHVFDTTPAYGQNGLGGVPSDQALPFSGLPYQDRARVNGGTGTTHTAAGHPAPPPSADQVTIGTDGWYFLLGVLQRACSPFISFAAATREWEGLLRVIRASGRRAELIVAPDKSTIYPEYLAPSTPDLACGNAGSAALWQQIENPSAARAGIVGLRQPLLALKRSSSTLLYYKTDSHWNSVGATTMVRAALPPLSRKVRMLPSDLVVTGPEHYSGDLLGLIGQTGSELAPTVTIQRRPGAPVIDAPTLLLGDSYTDAVLPELTPYIAHLTVLNWNTSPQPRQIAAIVAAHDIILETVEREFDYRATNVGFASPAFVAAVAKALAASPATTVGRHHR